MAFGSVAEMCTGVISWGIKAASV